MLDTNTLYIFANNRAIKQFVFSNYSGFLPDIYTINDFFNFVLMVKDKVKIPELLRRVYLYESIKKVNTKQLGEFANNFSSFLINSDFFLKFYDELCAGCISIDDLMQNDIYAFYDDHLKVLNEVFWEYRNKLSSNDFYDKYFMEDYVINIDILSCYSELRFYINGFLSRFEITILKEISYSKNIYIYLEMNQYNKQYYENMFGISIESGSCVFLLKDSEFSLDGMKKLSNSIKCDIYEFGNRIAEVGGIFSKIDSWLSDGVPPEDISIVLPDEDFVSYLQNFDAERNFNYAMGVKLKNSNFFSLIKKEILKKDKLQDVFAYLQGLNPSNAEANFIKSKILDSVEHFKCILKYFSNMDEADIISLFIYSLENESVDDIGGGKIKVLGILETRGVSFKYVVIPEFVEGIVPNVSNKDIFLNTTIRKKVSLATRRDRENLQKSYYFDLLNNSKEVYICTINNEEIKPSKFLLDKNIFNYEIKYASNIYNDYFIKNSSHRYIDREIIGNIEINSLSATSLKCWLDCRRKYYYKYILKLSNNEIKYHVSNAIHDALHKGFLGFIENYDFDKLILNVNTYLNDYVNNNSMSKFDIDLASKYISNLMEHERRRVDDGYLPKHLEKEFEVVIKDIKFIGRIDRIDINNKTNEVLVLDYKYKKNNRKDSNDFQLFLYKKATEKMYPNNNIKVGIYDLYNASVCKYDEEYLNKQEKKLDEILNELSASKEVSFDLTSKKQVCEYCDFKYICNRA